MPKQFFENLCFKLIRKLGRLSVFTIVGVIVWTEIVGEANSERGKSLYQKSSSLMKDTLLIEDTVRNK